MLALIALTALTHAVAAPPDAKPTAMVLVVGHGDAFDSRPGDQVRELLRNDAAAGFTVLDNTQTEARLGAGYSAPPPARAQKLSTLVQEAQRAFDELEFERAQDRYQQVLATLENEVELAPAEFDVLQRARVGAVVAQMTLAPGDESGRAETDVGKNAKGLLTRAILADPTLTLAAKRYPPKVRTLFETARADVQARGLGGLDIITTPPGVTVMIDNRPLGQTPLKLNQALPVGRYRLWLAHKGRRTPTRFIEVAAGAPEARKIDVALDITLWPKGRGIWPAQGETLTEALLQKVRGRAQVSYVIVAGDETGNPAVRYLAVAGPEGTRKGALVKDKNLDQATLNFLKATSTTHAGPAPLPPPAFFLPNVSGPGTSGTGAEPAASADEDEGGSGLFLYVGLGAAAAVVGAVVIAAAAATGGALFWHFTRPNDGASFDVVLE